MTASTPGRPDADDDLGQAYARAHALADDGREPPASVRANVLAAAREIAAQAKARAIAEGGVAPVAPPVTAVGRGRSMAVNLSSWRVRSGAAVCAALLVALGAWRFDASHRGDGGVQVATAALELAAPPTTSLPRELPRPPRSAASHPDVPPPIVHDPVGTAPAARAAAARPALREREKDAVVAQAEPSLRSLRFAPQPEVRAEARETPVPATPPAADMANAATSPAPVVALPAAPAPPRRSSADEVSVATAEPRPQRLQIAGSSLRRANAADAAGASPEAAKRPAPSGVNGRQPSMPLQSAADRGDVETLKTLLADPAARVDAPDAGGRTALLHAVLAQQPAAVRLLVGAGADPSRADPAGLTPRAAAQAGANAEIAALLGAPR